MTESFKLRQAEPLFDGWECPSVTSSVSPTSLRFPPPSIPQTNVFAPEPVNASSWWEPGDQRDPLCTCTEEPSTL